MFSRKTSILFVAAALAAAAQAQAALVTLSVTTSNVTATGGSFKVTGLITETTINGAVSSSGAGPRFAGQEVAGLLSIGGIRLDATGVSFGTTDLLLPAAFGDVRQAGGGTGSSVSAQFPYTGSQNVSNPAGHITGFALGTPLDIISGTFTFNAGVTSGSIAAARNGTSNPTFLRDTSANAGIQYDSALTGPNRTLLLTSSINPIVGGSTSVSAPSTGAVLDIAAGGANPVIVSGAGVAFLGATDTVAPYVFSFAGGNDGDLIIGFDLTGPIPAAGDLPAGATLVGPGTTLTALQGVFPGFDFFVNFGASSLDGAGAAFTVSTSGLTGVTGVAAIPEPAVLGLLAPVGLLLARRRA